MARESQKKEDTCARNVSKVAKCFVFPMICGSVRSKSRLAKAAGAEPCVQGRHEKLGRSAFQSQNVKSMRGFRPLLEVGMWKNCTPL